MFQCDAVDTSPDLGGKMSSKPSKWLFDVKGGRHERIRESFLSLDLFSLKFKNILWPYYGGGAIAPIAHHGSVTDWDFSQSQSYRPTAVHAENNWLLSRLRVLDFMCFMVENALSHTYVLKKAKRKVVQLRVLLLWN